jgi:hypothetical protein
VLSGMWRVGFPFGVVLDWRRIVSEYLVEDVGLPLNHWCPECSGPVKDEKAAMAYCIMHQPR